MKIFNRLFIVSAVLLGIYQGCSGPNSIFTKFNSETSNHSPPEKIPEFSSQTLTQSKSFDLYVKTPVESPDLCRDRFTSTVPDNLPSEILGPLTEPVRLIWDYADRYLLGPSNNYRYNPSFEPGRVSFAPNGRPLIRSRSFDLQILSDQGKWIHYNLLSLARESLRRQGFEWDKFSPEKYGGYSNFADPGVSTESRVVFDRDCHGYALLNAVRSTLGSSVLVHTYDGGRSWGAYKIPGSEGDRTATNMEVPGQIHYLSQAPALLIHEMYHENDPNDSSRLSGPTTLKLVVIDKNSNRSLNLSSAFLISDQAITAAGEGGNENYAVSSGSFIHIVYPGNSIWYDKKLDMRGTPAFAVSYSRLSKSLISPPTFLGIGVEAVMPPPSADDHDQPVIAVDSKSYLHVVLGGHNGMLRYLRSKHPNDVTTWEPPEIIGPHSSAEDGYTYPSLLLDLRDQPFVIARWSAEKYVFKLSYIQRGASNSPWSDHRVLADPGRPFYAHWNHKVSLSPGGGIFVNLQYLPDNLFADEAEILARTFHITMTPDPGCQASNHNQSPQRYCHYTGYGYLFNTLMLALNPQALFSVATTHSFYERY